MKGILNTPACMDVSKHRNVRSPVKSAERYRSSQADESCPEVDGVSYMPEVYKIPMVRMKRVYKLF